MNLKLKINNICEFDFTVLWVKERDGRWETVEVAIERAGPSWVGSTVSCAKTGSGQN